MRQFMQSQPRLTGGLNEETPFYKILEVLEYRKGLSEREVIIRLGVPRSTYRSWKDGTSEPSRRVYWRKLAAVFGAELEVLIFGTKVGTGVQWHL